MDDIFQLMVENVYYWILWIDSEEIPNKTFINSF